MIVVIHNADKLYPILEANSNSNNEAKFKTVVGKIIEQDIGECETLLNISNNFVYLLSELIKQELIEIIIAV